MRTGFMDVERIKICSYANYKKIEGLDEALYIYILRILLHNGALKKKEKKPRPVSTYEGH